MSAPRVLAIADRPGWAIDRKALNLQRVLAGRYDITVRYQREVTPADLDAADLVMVFYWLETLQMEQLPPGALAACTDRLVMGVCSHFELDGEQREPGVAMLNSLPRAVFVNSRLLEDKCRPLLTAPLHYTPNGVDTAFFTPAPRPREQAVGELRVGWAGSLGNMGAAQRGFHDVIEPAIAAVPGAVLHTAIREQQWRTAAEMVEWYRELDVYVCASVDEGTPNPCLEAAACGISIVTTRVGNMPELIVDGVNGHFHEGTVASLAERLTGLRDSPSLTAQLGARLRADIIEWDWARQAERYATMFDDVLGGSRAPRTRPWWRPRRRR
ncbi:MAG: glycosyltransferase family 4 protein [Ilumatobacteraceae bacterium]